MVERIEIHRVGMQISQEIHRNVRSTPTPPVLCRSVWAFADRSQSQHCLREFINNRCLPCNTFS
jgi:hypothetical protein